MNELEKDRLPSDKDYQSVCSDKFINRELREMTAVKDFKSNPDNFIIIEHFDKETNLSTLINLKKEANQYIKDKTWKKESVDFYYKLKLKKYCKTI